MAAPELEPRAIATTARRLRDGTLALLDSCSDEDLREPALPGWTVTDVLWHLAHDDRATVLLSHLVHFLPGRDLGRMEEANDDAVARVRGRGRGQLREQLETWGGRLQLVFRLTPGPVGRVRIPSAFGRLPLAWFGTLRCYDEWVHQWDVTTALERPEPALDTVAREQLAAFHLRALPAKPLKQLSRRNSVVALGFDDVQAPNWLFDLERRQHGPQRKAAPSVDITTDVPSFSLLAADRVSWKQLEADGRLHITGPDEDAARALLDIVRVV